MTRRLQDQLRVYQALHQNPKNELCHSLGIPFVTLSMVGLLSYLPVPFLGMNAGFALWLIGLAYYVYLDLRAGLFFSLVLYFVYVIAQIVSLEVHWVLFVLGWGLQWLGHLRYEKNSPSFIKRPTHILLGPFWLFLKRFDSTFKESIQKNY